MTSVWIGEEILHRCEAKCSAPLAVRLIIALAPA